MKKKCKWYTICPIKRFTKDGKLENYWVNNYSLITNNNYIRYKLEESGESHPDNLLPDGTIRDDLK